MKQIYQVIFGLMLFTSLTIAVSAHPGNTDSSGGHTCRTNCSNWGLSYGEYHYHNSKGSYQSAPPIRSHYGAGGTGTTEYWPAYESSYSSHTPPPNCPLHATYSYSSEQCKCNSGYFAKGSSCVSLDTFCQDDLGYNSRYNSSSDTCECSYGYVIDGGRCQDADIVCHGKFGYDSSYDSLSNSCECDYGYEMIGGQCEKEQDEYIPRTIINTPAPQVQKIQPKPVTTPTKDISGFVYEPSQLATYPLALSFKTTQAANVRSCPVKTCSLVTNLEVGTKIFVTAEYGNWRKVKIQENEGWIFKDLITKDASQPVAPVTTKAEPVKSGFFKKVFSWFR